MENKRGIVRGIIERKSVLFNEMCDESWIKLDGLIYLFCKFIGFCECIAC